MAPTASIGEACRNSRIISTTTPQYSPKPATPSKGPTHPGRVVERIDWALPHQVGPVFGRGGRSSSQRTHTWAHVAHTLSSAIPPRLQWRRGRRRSPACAASIRHVACSWPSPWLIDNPLETLGYTGRIVAGFTTSLAHTGEGWARAARAGDGHTRGGCSR